MNLGSLTLFFEKIKKVEIEDTLLDSISNP